MTAAPDLTHVHEPDDERQVLRDIVAILLDEEPIA